MKGRSLPIITFEHKRDTYGFAVRPQHLQRYREYANIYKEEEEERSERWKDFLERQTEAGDVLHDNPPAEESSVTSPVAQEEQPEETSLEGRGYPEELTSEEEVANVDTKTHEIQKWAPLSASLSAIEQLMSVRVKKRRNFSKDDQVGGKSGDGLASIDEGRPVKGASEEDSEEEFYDVEKADLVQDVASSDGTGTDLGSQYLFPPWREELESLVRGGVPKGLRGELWQAFVGVRARRVEGYYQDLLDSEAKSSDDKEINSTCDIAEKPQGCVNEKWKRQIEKDLPRTFPGHPALDEDGRDALRRLLTAYARHNPSVGYCQAMNFFAGILLLLMPEENAFWTLLGIIDDYFDGYYSEEMIESQVDLLILEEIVRERFPKLVNHLDYLGIQVTWVAGPWFLSIFVNMLPWESVLRVWDVLLFDGNRVMLFRTTLALMELYGIPQTLKSDICFSASCWSPALVTTKDAGDAVTLLQSLAGSTFDSSQLVLTACMGYQAVNETKLQELRKKHRPDVIAAMEERSKGLGVLNGSKGLATKLYSFKHDPGSLLSKTAENLGDTNGDAHLSQPESSDSGGFLNSEMVDAEFDSVPHLKEQVAWLKVELCRLLEEKWSATLRAEELETALMEMVKLDNRRILSAKVEQLEQEESELRQLLADKQEQEHAMLQVLMRVEQEQKVTEDARIFAEQDAAAQRYATHMLQEKYEEAMTSLAQMEKRAVMAETMLEATLQYQSGQVKAHPSPSPSPRTPRGDHATGMPNQESSQEAPTWKMGFRPFGLGWRDKNKGKPSTNEDSSDVKHLNDGTPSINTPQKDTNNHQESR
ncbi:TBC1 domain family member 8B-like isoform X3 [Dioscorea cayenensis subsp. rotundata]|uniref:TBC1 domain family member 8B-like isoform X3 n=1 Tax=Dioscorea cayennensis subsp. rotundata TaxID=55577 RepID=A0AB40BPP6_DIOCR|nr:TBC1 domain family member 8B-like isoform X3 [Dioscorea cayenensis subsp. rotundata]